MSDIIITELNDLELNLQYVKGEGYDSLSSMKGDKAGIYIV